MSNDNQPRTNPADHLTGRDGSGKPKAKAPADVHLGMTHKTDEGHFISGISRTESRRLLDTMKDTQIDETPAAKNLASAAAEPTPGMHAGRAAEYNADRAAGLGAQVLNDAVQKVRKP